MDVFPCSMDIIFLSVSVVEGYKELEFKQGLKNGNCLDKKQGGSSQT